MTVSLTPLESALIRTTIWAALIAYASGEWGRVAPLRTTRDGWARIVWSAGALLYLAHVVAAFAFAYEWSHARAYAHTAEQTAALTGVARGGGIWVNYLFTAVWLTDAAWWWVAPVRYRARRRSVEYAVRATFLFMIVNGAVVFASGPVRFLGTAVIIALCAIWLLTPGASTFARERAHRG